MIVNKTIVYLLYFCVYSILLLIFGKSSIEENDIIRHFYVGNRNLGTLSCMLTFTGTWISAATILGFTGNVFESGYPTLMYSFFPWFTGAILMYLITNRLYENDVITIPELFGKRYQSKALQVVFAAIVVVVYVFYLVIQIKGFAVVASNLFEIPYTVSTFMIYLFILYATFGGYRSVIRVDSFNIAALTVGIIIIFVVVVGHAGGIGEIHRQVMQVSGRPHDGVDFVNQPGDMLMLFGKNNFTPAMSMTMFFSWGLGLAANPQYAIRLISAKDKRTARRTVITSLAYLVLFYFSLLMIGLGMRVLFPTLEGISSADDIFVHIINNLLYTPFSGFFLFAVIGACISTANSQLLLIATSCAYDIVGVLHKKPLQESQLLLISRLSIFIGGTLSLFLSFNPPDDLLVYGGDIWGIFGVTLFPTLYGTLVYPKSTRQGIWAALITGGSGIAIFYPMYYGGVLSAHPAFPATLLSLLSFWLVSRHTWKRGEVHAG